MDLRGANAPAGPLMEAARPVALEGNGSVTGEAMALSAKAPAAPRKGRRSWALLADRGAGG
ncbi:MAG TPA: hypothetical protein VFF77_05585, partial [Holophagaceae bacterium]|nr:hypothetical protein [Holophagaceae bacterium]